MSDLQVALSSVPYTTSFVFTPLNEKRENYPKNYSKGEQMEETFCQLNIRLQPGNS